MGRRDDNVVLIKAKDFAVRVVNLYKFLRTKKHETAISNQLIRCGTSVGANLHEAIEGISDSDFRAKVYIALKEARESEYWLELLHRTKYLSDEEYDSINADCSELLSLLVSICKTINSKQDK